LKGEFSALVLSLLFLRGQVDISIILAMNHESSPSKKRYTPFNVVHNIDI
jgi:hypothetical protein